MENVLLFLSDLKENNNREWFHANKDRYQDAKKTFEIFVTKLLAELSNIDKELAGLEAKQCIFRIFRDVRFSKDKSPYKINMGAAMTKGGRKSPYATYYIHLEPGNSFAGGGIWQALPIPLKAMRQEVYYNAGEFKDIINDPIFVKYFDVMMGDKLKRPPRDFPAEFPDIELLKYKSYVVGHPLDDKLVTSDNLMDELRGTYKALYPFNRFINRALTDI